MTYYGQAPATKLFISHDWEYHEHYEGVVALLNNATNFCWDDLSVPRDKPLAMLFALPKSNRTIVYQLDERMRQADCALILAGVYSTNSAWIQSEIEAAQEFRKPILGIRPRGQERVSAIVQGSATEMVYWNSATLQSLHAGC